MPQTIGYHIVKSGYGLWLPGDDRGSWSEGWDDQIGYFEPHMLHEADPVRLRMAEERMAHAPVRLDTAMMSAILETIEQCAAESDWRVAAMSIEPTHLHMLLTYTPRDIDGVAKWLAQRTTRAIHEQTNHRGPVWAKGKWCSFIYETRYWDAARDYIERHNVRRGLTAQPYAFIHP